MIANAMAPLYFVLSPLAALSGLLVAITVETPVLWLLWSRRPATILRWTILANATSAVAGIAPVVWYGLSGNLVDVDPWHVYQDYWPQQMRLAGLMFGLSVALEGIVYARLPALNKWRVFIGSLVSNITSYALLLAFAWLSFLARTPPGFSLLPDTQQMNLGEGRVWFVDGDSRHLCSIKLDGTDRRTELAIPMRDYWMFPHQICAVLPTEHTILYTDDDFRWHASGGDEHPRVLTESDEKPWYRTHSEAWPKVRRALEAAGIASATQPDGALPELFYYAWNFPIWTTERDNERLHVETATLPNGLSFWRPLTVTHKSNGRVQQFFLTSGFLRVGCWEPAILNDLIVFRCGAWIMVMDVESGKVGRLVRGYNLLLQSPDFGPPPAATRAGSQPTASSH